MLTRRHFVGVGCRKDSTSVVVIIKQLQILPLYTDKVPLFMKQ